MLRLLCDHWKKRSCICLVSAHVSERRIDRYIDR